MKKSIYYWSPCLGKIGTVKSTINSAIATSIYGRLNYKVFIINSCGEWDDYEDLFSNHDITLINFKYKFLKGYPFKVSLKVDFHIL